MSYFGAPPPSTPPRRNRTSKQHVTMKSPVDLRTPQTHNLRKTKDFFATPSSTTKSNSGSGTVGRARGKDISLMPLTPDFTPQKSPRAHRRKRSYIDDIFKADSSSVTSSASSNASNLSLHQDNLGFLLPTPSTIGSGRKLTPSSSSKIKPAALTFDTLSKLNDNLKFESDDEEQEQSHDNSNVTQKGDDVNDFFLKPNNKPQEGQFVLNSNLLKSPTQIVRQPSSPTKLSFSSPSIPQTPLKQLINDDKVNDWHGKSQKYFSDDDISEDELAKPKELVNPFLTDSTTDPTNKRGINVNNPFNSSNNNVCSKGDTDYSTHVEYIHGKTGEKKVVKLLERQANIKPKKLDFSSAI